MPPHSFPQSTAIPKRRICHVITRMIVGGAQENTLLTVRGLLEKGHEVELVTGPTEGPEGRLLQSVSVPGLNVVEIPELKRPVRPVTDLRAYHALLRHFREHAFDVVHTHSSKAGILGRLAARRCGCPLVVHTVHGQPFHPYETWWKNQLFIAAERWAAKRCDHIIAVARAMVDQCVAAGVAPADKYTVIYSGMRTDTFANTPPDTGLRTQLGIPDGVPVIGKIARLFDLKGHDLLLAAAPAVVRAFPDTRFLLVGDGNLRPQLEQEVKDRSLENNVIFAGLVPPADIPRYLSLMDALVHLSLREGLPRTVVQALASGVPAVAFALDGTPEVIEHERTGYLCTPESVSEVRDALLALLRDPANARRMGRLGQSRVCSQFDWRRMVDQIETLYAKLS